MTITEVRTVLALGTGKVVSEALGIFRFLIWTLTQYVLYSNLIKPYVIYTLHN